MITQTHRKRHIELHAALAELVADWITESGGRPSAMSIAGFIQWSYRQTTAEVQPEPLIDPGNPTKPPLTWNQASRVFAHAVSYGAENDNYWTDLAHHIGNILTVTKPGYDGNIMPRWMTPAEFIGTSLAEVSKNAIEIMNKFRKLAVTLTPLDEPVPTPTPKMPVVKFSQNPVDKPESAGV